eukprot:scaffold311970_cov63-Attheya_sp.AAC.2
MGDNKENAYDAFCDYILPAVCGRKSNEAKFNHMRVSEVATASDEAFTLLSLENAWDMWVYPATNPDDSENIPHTKYSNEGSSARAQIYAGWKVSGTERFRELQKMVKQNGTADMHAWSLKKTI